MKRFNIHLVTTIIENIFVTNSSSLNHSTCKRKWLFTAESHRYKSLVASNAPPRGKTIVSSVTAIS